MNVYTLYKDGKEVFTGSQREINVYLNLKRSSVSYALHTKTLYHGHKVKLCKIVEQLEKYDVYSLDGTKLFTGNKNEISIKYDMNYMTLKKYCGQYKVINGKVIVLKHKQRLDTTLLSKCVSDTYIKEPYEFKGTKMILHKTRDGKLIKTTFLPLIHNS